MSIDLLQAPLAACAVCGGAVDDFLLVIGSSVGFAGLAMGFELAYEKVGQRFGWLGPADPGEQDPSGSVSTADDPSVATSDGSRRNL